MEVITIESDTYKDLIDKIDAIACYIKNEREQSDTKIDEIWVDSYEVCTFLRISDRTLQRLRSNGQISYSILSGKTYYKIAEIKRILEEHLIKAGDEYLDDLIEHHQKYNEIRRKNKPGKKDSKR
ncbi:MAG: helix-turn-helix domain-containing protein [Tannerella sp.]|nr:helix-turn-helix domain-containing protein [Tannerella sp.]